MRIHESFSVARPPEAVFAFIVAPENLAKWQTIKTRVTPLTEGPTRLGSRFREGNKVGLRRWDQVVEVVEFEPARVFAVRVTEGPESGGRWTIEPEGSASRVQFEAEFKAPRLLAPVARRVIARQFRGYHGNLRRELEALRAV
jgi:carbon monoxide dehydrogenase subunit G